MAGDLPLDRYHRLQAGAADLRRLPFTAQVEGQTVAREGEDLVVLHDGRTERFREAEVAKRGLRGLFGGTEPGVWWHDGSQSHLLRPDGRAEDGEFPGGVPSDAEIRAVTRDAQALLAGVSTPLQKAVAGLPFGTLAAAKSVLQATAPALPGPAGTVALAAAMAGAFPASAPAALPVVRAELAASTDPVPRALASALEQPPRDPAATLTAAASLVQNQAVTLDLAVQASRMPGGTHLVPALLAAAPGVEPDSWTGRYLGQGPSSVIALPRTASEYVQAAAKLDRAPRQAMLAAARGLGPEGDLVADLAATSDVGVLASVLAAETPGAAAAAALKGEAGSVARLLSYAARTRDPAVETLLAVGGVRTSGAHESSRGIQAAVLPRLLAGDPAAALAAGLSAASSRGAVADLSRLLLPELPQPQARVLEDLLDQPFDGQYESLGGTVRAGLDKAEAPMLEFAQKLLDSTNYSVSQRAIVRSLAAHWPSPPVALRVAARLADEPFAGQYESFGATVKALLKPPGGKTLLQAGLGSTNYRVSQAATVKAWLDLEPSVPPAAASFLRGVVALPFGGQYESLGAVLTAVVPKLDASAGTMLRAALGATNYAESARGLIGAFADAAETPVDRRLAGFLKAAAAAPFGGQHESLTTAVKAAMAAPLAGDSPGQAVLRAGLAAVGTTNYSNTKVTLARAAASAAAPDPTEGDLSALFRSRVSDEEIAADPAGALQRLLDGWSEAPVVGDEAPAGEIRQEPETVTIGGIALPVQGRA